MTSEKSVQVSMIRLCELPESNSGTYHHEVRIMQLSEASRESCSVSLVSCIPFFQKQQNWSGLSNSAALLSDIYVKFQFSY